MRIAHFVFVSLLTMLCVCYVYHKSIIAYIVQQYHYASNMIASESPFFSFGNIIASGLEKMRVAIFEAESNTIELALPQYDESHMTHILELNEIKYEDKELLESKDTSMSLQDFKSDSTDIISTIPQEQYITPIESTYNYMQDNNQMLILPPGTRFLLIGDSLMQGIGMVLPRMLQEHGFRTKNIAKQSTGLTYPSFFDWENATLQAFQQYKDIGVLVVCLGANDPWNMPKMRFGSESWEATYKKRIQAIINVAKSHHAEVVWYAVPMTKNEALNKKLMYLNTLYQQIVSENGGIFLTADAILQNGRFSAYIKDGKGKSRLVRAQDGIHFTPYGSRLLAKTLIKHIVLPKQDVESEMEITPSKT
ncbi:SGNH/GDSL hydrolase family protein [Helicobacter trogontum]|uniref:DUF459 domain-containing protein n=1 Tax=Helicobacter trogontum TaxID=50960 RepID=A0A4U8S9W2_9HELI|nr:DUF459 domain-containing protein [Helicobacter trogontum]TLD82818.1 DUF459 domain-containing protein [Helicobacter trogontum]